MKERRFVRLLGVLAICLICLWTVGGNVRAAEQWKATGEVEKKKVSYDAALRRHFKKNLGYYLGKSKHCYYTYAQNIYGTRKNGLVIVGFEENVREIRIPEKIKGKKVVAICMVVPDVSYDEELRSIQKKSKTQSIVIPRYVDGISGDSIARMSDLMNLKKIKVSPKNKYFMAKSGVLFTKDGKTLLNYPDGRGAFKYRIPEGVTDVSDNAFEDASVRQVIMPDTVKLISPGAFSYSRIERVSLSKNLKYIQSGAFRGSRLKKISLPKKLKYIGDGAFGDTELREIIIPGNVKEIPDFCFESCKRLKKVTFKQGVKKIGERAFLYCYGLKKVVMPSSVKKIVDNPFEIDPKWDGEYEKGEVDPKTKDQMAWRSTGVTIYVKKGCYAYRKFSEKYWREQLGIKVKVM